jgi:hypothetical protein
VVPVSPPQRRRKAPWIIGGALVAALIAAAAVGVVIATGDDGKSDAATSGDTMRGIAILFDTSGDVTGDWDDCEGTGGYSDFDAGMALTIKDKSGDLVGTGNVVNASDENLDDIVQADWDGDDPIGLDEQEDLSAAESELRGFLSEMEGIGCLLYFEASIEDSDFYSVEMGSRGELSYSRDDLEKQGFVVSLSLGN